MATFKCLQSGNTVTFTLQHDIDSMRGHQGYVLVDDNGKEVPNELDSEKKHITLTAPARKLGRPRKA
jgi:hypothetical protein